jgi:hypothetical protein
VGVGGDGSNDVNLNWIPSFSRHTMEIVKACVTPVHPDLNVVVFEAVCLDGGLISEHRAVQEGGVIVQPYQQVSRNPPALSLFIFRQVVPECYPTPHHAGAARCIALSGCSGVAL